MNEKQKGGKRDNAGRKPTDDPKIPVTVYVETSVVQKNGGKVKLAQRILDAIKSDFVENPIMQRVAENNKPENKKRILEERQRVSIKNFNQPQPTTNFVVDTEKPIRGKDEGFIDYQERLQQWKQNNND